MSRAAITAAPGLPELARRVQPVTLARDRRIAVGPPLDAVLPEGLARGTAVAVGARPGVAGATSLALALVAWASQDGAWTAVVGAPWLGLVAAAEVGVALERLVVVDVGGVIVRAGSGPQSLTGNGCQPTDRGRREAVAGVVAALVDGFDVVLVGPTALRRLQQSDTRRLLARVRERGGVVVTMDRGLPGGGAQVELEVTASTWEGLEPDGGGHVRRCRAIVEARGRGAASRPRRADLTLRGVASPEVIGSGLAEVEVIGPGGRNPSPQPRPTRNLLPRVGPLGGGGG